MTWRVGVAAVVVAAIGCSTAPGEPGGHVHPTEACRDAAVVQAYAEDAWAETLHEHANADAALAEAPSSDDALADHDRAHGRALGARVDLILAESATRHACG